MNFHIFDVSQFITFNILIVLQIFTFGHWESIDSSSKSFCFLTGFPASRGVPGSPAQFLLLTSGQPVPQGAQLSGRESAIYSLHPGLHIATGLAHVSRFFQSSELEIIFVEIKYSRRSWWSLRHKFRTTGLLLNLIHLVSTFPFSHAKIFGF